MTLSESPDVRDTRGPSLGSLRIPSKFVLALLPLAIVSLIASLFLVWFLIADDATEGFSSVDILAISIGTVVMLVVVGSLFAAYFVGRSISKGIVEVTQAADLVARKELFELLDALRSSEPDLASIAPLELDVERDDEVGDLARSFADLHSSLIDVAARQLEALRKGVSNIFVTLARRNSSLVDRQLAVLDELEAREEDPRTLGGYYQIDHLATRMRRNAESLLVLAGSESPRTWAKATDMTDVVRAAVGEVDEYQRIDVLALEPARLSGAAVSDVSHLLAELLENALQFSPPSEAVRVTGLFDLDGYQLTVSDRGVGISDARLAELNRILEKPPALGLSVEPTLGMYVIAKLAHRHGLRVELIQAMPGLTARVTVSRDHLDMSDGRTSESRESHHQPAEPFLAQRFEEAESVGGQRVAERVMSSVEPREEELIDLTTPAMTERTSLTVRTPGRAFNDDDETASSGPAQDPVEIRSALSAFDRGRRAAEREGSEDENVEEGH